MTNDEKELILKDLCGRLPYGVIVEDQNGTHRLSPNDTGFIDLFSGKCNIKPYLRSMSSMTEEERNEYFSIKMQEMERVALAETYRPEAISVIMNWLDKYMFDYRGLIEKGSALEALGEMYQNL